MYFKDRSQAGRLLGDMLKKYKDKENVVLMALPRGGVVVSYEIAKVLHLPLDVLLVKKIGSEYNEELALAAVTEHGFLYGDNNALVQQGNGDFYQQIQRYVRELKRRREHYEKHVQDIKGKTVILVDDGVATGFTLHAAILDLKDRQPKEIILAIPIIPYDMLKQIRPLVHRLYALEIPPIFAGAVGNYYINFSQVEDIKVKELLKRSEKYSMQGGRKYV